jgi:hypothetical protein
MASPIHDARTWRHSIWIVMRSSEHCFAAMEEVLVPANGMIEPSTVTVMPGEGPASTSFTTFARQTWMPTSVGMTMSSG